MSGAYDTLYNRKTQRGWLDRISPEARAWLEGLADHILENGEPIWVATYEAFVEQFPDDAPLTDTTVRENTRKLVKQRGV